MNMTTRKIHDAKAELASAEKAHELLHTSYQPFDGQASVPRMMPIN